VTKQRKYQQTHPWLSFTLNSAKVPATTWLNLGEARSKSEHLAGEPLQPDTAQLLHLVYLAKGVNATTAIEGNTLTEAEVRLQVEGKLTVPQSKEYLQQETQNIIDASNEIGRKLVEGKPPPLHPETVKWFNSMVLNKLILPPHAVPGVLRACGIEVGPYAGPPAEDCEYLLGRLCDWLTGDDFACHEDDEIVYAIFKAVIAHLYLAWIHPFGDGNGRTARLIEFLILLSAGVPSVAAHLLSNHYNQTRQEYYRQLDHASKSGGDIIPFISYAVQGFVDGLREQLALVKVQQSNVVWENFVYDHFKEDDSASSHRQRRLALDLGNVPEAVPVSKIRELSAKTARNYANKTDRTIQRDINALAAMKLLKRTPSGIKANREAILAFLPVRVRRPSGQQTLDFATKT
jgi:Fic family protein